MKKYVFVSAVVATLSLQSVYADIVVNFVESAPKDRFVITNNGNCEYSLLTMEIDLRNSAGRLIFDTTAAGAGVEVFQPFEVSQGQVRLLFADQVTDGDQMLSVEIKALLPNTSASFTIDLDDTLTESELGNIRISASEIMDGKVNVSYGTQPALSANFSSKSIAVVPAPECETE